MAAESRPHLITAYAAEDRIVVGSRGEAGIGELLGSVIATREIAMLGRLVDGQRHQQAPAHP
jgi:hypothetical protein